jgi:hypothetical protein
MMVTIHDTLWASGAKILTVGHSGPIASGRQSWSISP